MKKRNLHPKIKKDRPLPHHKEPRNLSSIIKMLSILFLVFFVSYFCIAPFIALKIKVIITVFVFFVTILIIFLRPHNLNEAYPAAIGAIIVLSIGSVSFPNLVDIIQKIGGASITIISTLVMAFTLEGFGFFRWAAVRIAILVRQSGYRLYWFIQLLCFLMTLLFNNDGSILIATPIIILLLEHFHLKPHQKIPYLISGAIIATGSSAPIGVSNIVNLISLNIIHMSLFSYTAMMFIPSMLGLIFLSFLMFLVLKKSFPRTLNMPINEIEKKRIFAFDKNNNHTKSMLKILAFVFTVRLSIFAASFIGIPIEIVAVFGSVTLLAVRWYYLHTNPVDVVKKTPWHIFIFAFSMYVIIYGLNNIGLADHLAKLFEPIVSKGLFSASFVMGGLVSILSNVFNNHPALMIGTITLTKMNLDSLTLQVIYLSNIIGSDIGSLLLPIGTLASLLWMHILQKNRIMISWKDYIKVTIAIIPPTIVFTLLMLYLWIQMFFP
jgi:arsenical pump membrane protein